MAMPKSQYQAKRKTARTEKRSSKRRAARQAARRGHKEIPRSQRVDRRRGVGLFEALMAQSLFATLVTSKHKTRKFSAAAHRKTTVQARAAKAA